MYTKNENHNIILYDVDDTLVYLDPIPGVDPISIKNGSYTELVYPDEEQIKKLKMSKVRGHFVRVNSQGGADWAEAVIKALGLEEYVDSIETKAKWYVDDLSADSWMIRLYKDPRK